MSKGVAVAQESQCNCSLLLEEAIKNVSEVYAGYSNKVTSKTRGEYDRLVGQLSRKAVDITSPNKCYEIIKNYTDWFKDGHVGIWFGVKSSAAEIRKLPLPDLKQKPDYSNDRPEGLWSTADQTQEFAITKDPSGENKYLAVTIKSNEISRMKQALQYALKVVLTSFLFAIPLSFLAPTQGIERIAIKIRTAITIVVKPLLHSAQLCWLFRVY